jgi:hypothetical protein
MSSAALQRQSALAGAALLAALLVLVLDRPSPSPTVVGSPPPVSAASWEEAQILVAPAEVVGACEGEQVPEVRGIVHPVLPCGVKLLVSANGRTMRAEVVAEGPVATGGDFALTKALARDLGVSSGDRIRWRFAG